MRPDDLSPDEYELLARIANRYYADDRTQEQIAREFGLSRPKVQRLLERARWTGVVDIRIEAPPWLHLDLESRLSAAFSLSGVIVSPTAGDPLARRASVARSAARYLERCIREGFVIAVGHGRDTGVVPQFFRPGRRIACTFASAMGGSPRVDTPTNPNEICRALAEKVGGRAEILYAPAYVESGEMRDRLLTQEAVAHTLDVAARATVALVGIGGVDDGATMVLSGCLSVDEMVRLREHGAVGDILGNFVDIDGRLIESPHGSRLVALTFDHLRRIPTVVAVASEAEKPRAILGALRAGVIDVLVVDETNALTILDLDATAAGRGSTLHEGGGVASAPG